LNIVQKNYDLIKLKACPVCDQDINNINNEILPPDNVENFYVKSLSIDFDIDLENFNKNLKIIRCSKCFSTYYNKWFDLASADRIYNSIYGQHNYGWQNYYNFIEKSLYPNHGNLFENYFTKMEVNTYGEYNCPFSGLLFNIFKFEYGQSEIFNKKLNKQINEYFISRQLAKKLVLNDKIKKIDPPTMQEIQRLKQSKKINDKTINSYLLYDSSSYCWSYNCISESVNCKSTGQLMLGFKSLNLNYKLNEIPKFDCFGFFMVLDHQKDPMNLLSKILNKSRYVILHLHTSGDHLTKQHLFSFSKEFINYLKSNKIFAEDITLNIKKDKKRNKGANYLDNQIYLVCSLSKESLSLVV